MKITERQRMLIGKIDQILYRRKASGRHGYFLGVEECTSTINSLIVKGLVQSSENRKVLRWTGMMPRA